MIVMQCLRIDDIDDGMPGAHGPARLLDSVCCGSGKGSSANERGQLSNKQIGGRRHCALGTHVATARK